MVAAEERDALGPLAISAPIALEELADDLGLTPLAEVGAAPGQQRFAIDLAALCEGRTGPAGLLAATRRWLLGVPRQMPTPSPALEPAEPSPLAEPRGESVRAALSARHRPHDLKRSPLVALRIVQRRVGPRCPPEEALASVLDEACRSLAASAAYASSARLLEVTYLDPRTEKQEAAAAELRLPFGTYRYQLRRALELVTEELAARERREG
jgi:hypothetical protein